MKDRWLIVGGDGLLGSALKQHWRRSGREFISTSRKAEASETNLRLDLSQSPRDWPAFPECRAAVFCASMTNLELCRRDPVGTRRVNVDHTLALARQLASQDCFILFISSNLVFNGSKPFRQPDEPTCPRTEYGRQKAEVEAGLAAMRDRAGIVRLTKVIHPASPLFQGWKQSLAEGKEISAFADFVCSPIPLATTVGAIAAIAEKPAPGIWHLSGSADVCYAEIARQMAVGMKKDPALVRAVSGHGTTALEHSPEHTTLDASRSKSELGFEIPEPEVSIRQTFFS